MIAEVHEIASGERTARLLHATADRKTAKMNGRKAETCDQIFHEFDWPRVIAGHEDHPTPAVFCRPLVKTFDDDGIERLHQASTGRQSGDHLARSLVAKVR